MRWRWRGRDRARTAAVVHPTFRDPQRQAAFDRDGYIVMDLLDAEEVARLAEGVARVTDEARDLYPPDRGFATSIEIIDRPHREAVHAVLSDSFSASIEEHFVDHQMTLTAIATKWPGEAGRKPIHQDWTLCDEDRYRAVNLWVPLIDTTVENGTLFVLPGSHYALDRLRPAPRFPSGYRDPVEDLDLTDLVPLELRAGQAIALDLALVHGSPPNLTNEPRVAVAANTLPRSSTATYYFCDTDDRIERYTGVTTEFFHRFDFHVPPLDLVAEGEVEFRARGISAEELLVECATGSGSHP